MGVDLGDLVPKHRIKLSELSGKSLAVDAYNALYQFLAIIRGTSGQPLQDSKGRVTSHLSGLFYRTANLLERNIRLVYVFDGEPPQLKRKEISRRSFLKEEATTKYLEALEKRQFEVARKYAQATSRLGSDMIADAKKLLDLMGVPWIQAASEGEAQAAHMTSKGLVWAEASQDFDCLLFAAPRLVRNLAISGRRKLPGRDAYVKVEPEIIYLEETLSHLGISQEQLVDISILIGTDYNPEGIRGVGPKKALTLIREYGRLERFLDKLPDAQLPSETKRIREIFLSPEVVKVESLEWKPSDVEGVVDFLCREHDFNEERIRGTLSRMKILSKRSDKSTLESYFG